MTQEVWLRHQEWLDRRGYSENPCAGVLLFTERAGAMWFVECDRCGFEAGVPAHSVSPKARVLLRSENAGFPAMYAGREFETTAANEPVKQAVREWVAGYADGPLPAPAFYGRNGVGKTHLLVATCEQLLKRHEVSVRFWPIAGLLDDLQDAFGDNRQHQRVWQDATQTDVLALDDLGAERVTEWRADRLARLVDERYSHERPIILATNYPPVAWEQTLDPRTLSRLLGMTFQVELRGDDRRLVAA